jgi:hypothetical protein
MTLNKEENNKQMSLKDEHHICYNCHESGHLIKVSEKSKTPKPNLSIDSNMLRRPTIDICTRNVISSTHSRTKGNLGA